MLKLCTYPWREGAIYSYKDVKTLITLWSYHSLLEISRGYLWLALCRFSSHVRIQSKHISVKYKYCIWESRSNSNARIILLRSSFLCPVHIRSQYYTFSASLIRLCYEFMTHSIDYVCSLTPLSIWLIRVFYNLTDLQVKQLLEWSYRKVLKIELWGT